MSFLVKRLFKINVSLKTSVSIFFQCEWDLLELLFTAVLPKRLYKTHTPGIHYHLRDKTHTSYHGLIKRARQTPSLHALSPFPMFLHWRSPLPFCLSFFPFLGYARGSYLILQPRFYRLPRVRHSIRSHTFSGQYFLFFFPFVCSIFLVVFFALVVFTFNAFLIFSCIRSRDFSLKRESNSLSD